MKEKIKIYFNEYKIGTKTMFKEFFKKETNKKQRANMWTFSRLLSPFIALLFSIISIFSSNPILFLLLSGVITGIGASTDFFDGRSARKHNSTSEYGKQLDQITDKIFSILTATNLLFFNLNYTLILVGEIIISFINIYYKKRCSKLSLDSSKIGKFKQWPLFCSLCIGFLIPLFSYMINISNILIIFTTTIQLITSINYIIRNENEIKVNNNKNGILNSYENEGIFEIKPKYNIIEIANSKTKLKLYKELKDKLNELIKVNDEQLIKKHVK